MLASAEEWLPPGWMAEIKVRNNGKKDRFYIDPSKAHKFKSKPDVLRYLKSLESTPESEGKRRSSRNHPSVDLPAEAERVNLADSGTNGNINDRSVNQTDTLKDEEILKSSAAAACGKETSLLNQKEKNKSRNGEYDSAIIPEAPPQNMPEVEKAGNKRLQIGNSRSKNNDKKPDLPRRASKRLAGVEVDPVPELSPTNRTRRVSARRVGDTDAATAKSSLDSTKLTPIKDDKHDCSSEGSCMPKEPNLLVSTNNDKSDDVAGVSLDVPLQDIWKDPCIEFAIKTLTGQIPIEEVLGQNKPPTEIPKPSAELPSGDLWGDPCIEFAVKTLTGDIPLDCLSFQDHFQGRDKSSGFSLGSGSVSNSDGSLTSGFPPNAKSSFQKASDGGIHSHCEGSKRAEDCRKQTVRL